MSGSTLKIIACFIMLIDHTGAAILERYIIANNLYHGVLYQIDTVLRGVGRIAFPIFCFLLVQGLLHTSNRLKYFLSLLIFAFISEIPFDLALAGKPFDFSHQNVFFTLAIGLLVIWLWNYLESAELKLSAFVKTLLQLGGAVIGLAAGYFLKTDYNMFGVLTIIIMYATRIQYVLQALSGSLILTFMNLNEIYAFASIIPAYLYNGKRGMKLKYFFYLFYPVHLLLLWGIYTFLIN